LLLLRGVEKTARSSADVLAKAREHQAHTKFLAEVYVLTKDEAGRHTPFFKATAPSSTSANGRDGQSESCGGRGDVMPGRQRQMTIDLITPIAMEEQLRFAIREGGRTVGPASSPSLE